MRENILLTGRPGVGKTTVIRRVVEQLEGWKVHGFYSQEMREGRRRVGFQVVTLDGQRGRLAEVGFTSPYRVSRYGVDVESFERVALPTLAAPQADLIVVDEIGKMECFSRAFREAVQRALEGPAPVLGTIGRGGPPFMKSIRQREDVRLIEVTRANRMELPTRLAQMLIELRGEKT
ncbi:MAG: NTPase [Chloroflexota bacterium]|nr:NTPase [Chloroflexota bacterium]